MHTLTRNLPNLVIKLSQWKTTERGPKQEPWIKETNRGTYISADSCTSSAAEKKASFRHRSKLLATNIFNNTPKTWKRQRLQSFQAGRKKRNTHTKLCLVKNKSCCWVGWFFLSLPFLCYGDTEQGTKRGKEAFKERERRLSDPSLFFILHVLFCYCFFRAQPVSLFSVWLWSGVATSTMLLCFPLKVIRHVCHSHTWQSWSVTWRVFIGWCFGGFYGSP